MVGTADEAARGFDWSAVPIAVWAVAVGAVALAANGAWLLVGRWRHRAAGEAAEAALRRFVDLCRAHAERHGGEWPARIEHVDAGLASQVTYRPAVHAERDVRLLVAHGREATHRVIEFPVLRAGRAVWFAGGKLRVVSEDVFAKLVEADDRLRERLGLEPVGAARAATEDDDGG